MLINSLYIESAVTITFTFIDKVKTKERKKKKKSKKTSNGLEEEEEGEKIQFSDEIEGYDKSMGFHDMNLSRPLLKVL